MHICGGVKVKYCSRGSGAVFFFWGGVCSYKKLNKLNKKKLGQGGTLIGATNVVLLVTSR